MNGGKTKWTAWLLRVRHFHSARKIVVAIIGTTVTLFGIALIVLPGPAIVVIPIGLSILATEFIWAKRWLDKAREMTTRFTSKRPRDS
jgi:tellurite resistance protein TerC